MSTNNTDTAPLTAEAVAGITQCLVARDMHYEADMLTTLATQLAERDAELARVTAELDTAQAGWDDQKERHKECFQASYKTLIRSLDAEHALIATNARIAALTEALRTIHTRAISTRGDQAYREFPRFAEKASRAALTTDKEPKT